MSETVLAATDTTDAAGTSQTETPAADPSVVDNATILEAATETGQTGDATEGDTTAESSEDGKADGAPEDYGDFEMPEGVKADEDALAMAKEMFKDLNLSKEQAQKLVDLQVKLQQSTAQKWAATVDGWGAALKADKEIGGAALPQNAAVASKALQQFFSPSFVAEVVSGKGLGLGNHPEFVRGLVNVGKALSEHQLVTSQAAVQAERDPAKRLYPSMN